MSCSDAGVRCQLKTAAKEQMVQRKQTLSAQDSGSERELSTPRPRHRKSKGDIRKELSFSGSYRDGAQGPLLRPKASGFTSTAERTVGSQDDLAQLPDFQFQLSNAHSTMSAPEERSTAQSWMLGGHGSGGTFQSAVSIRSISADANMQPWTPYQSLPDASRHLSLNPTTSLLSLDVVPRPDVTNLCLDIYFSFMDVNFPMLHRQHIYSNPNRLLLYTAMLLAPFLGPDPVPGAVSPAERKQWDQAVLGVVKSELLAVMQSPETAPIEVIAAVISLRCYFRWKGTQGVADEFCLLAMRLLHDAGLTQSNVLPPRQSFEQVAQREFGEDWRTRAFAPDEIARMRARWIEHWSRERIATTALMMRL